MRHNSIATKASQGLIDIIASPNHWDQSRFVRPNAHSTTVNGHMCDSSHCWAGFLLYHTDIEEKTIEPECTWQMMVIHHLMEGVIEIDRDKFNDDNHEHREEWDYIGSRFARHTGTASQPDRWIGYILECAYEEAVCALNKWHELVNGVAGLCLMLDAMVVHDLAELESLLDTLDQDRNGEPENSAIDMASDGAEVLKDCGFEDGFDFFAQLAIPLPRELPRAV